ncbi:MAG TPA: hypothetical protein VN026_02760 [Bacteroidia bacterium]|jgi:hypothetical protein|nr:hypothetical protein [Bacteroidia bacterium]
MKKAIIVLSVLFLVSCEKHGMRDDDDDAKKCQAISNESVPASVQTSFKTKYPQNVAEKWFNKDDNGFTARFSQGGNKVLAQFDNSGNFKSENVMPPPPSNGPGGQPCNHGGHYNGHHFGFFGFGHEKHHGGNCNHEHGEKNGECHVELMD